MAFAFWAVALLGVGALVYSALTLEDIHQDLRQIADALKTTEEK